MKITNETKAKVFAQYLGQRIIENENNRFTGILESCGLTLMTVSNDEYISDFIVDANVVLILKPLDKITYEELNQLEQQTGIKVQRGEIKFSIFTKSVHEGIIITQFLQSKGYDLPNYLLNGKTLHESGLAIYE